MVKYLLPFAVDISAGVGTPHIVPSSGTTYTTTVGGNTYSYSSTYGSADINSNNNGFTQNIVPNYYTNEVNSDSGYFSLSTFIETTSNGFISSLPVSGSVITPRSNYFPSNANYIQITNTPDTFTYYNFNDGNLAIYSGTSSNTQTIRIWYIGGNAGINHLLAYNVGAGSNYTVLFPSNNDTSIAPSYAQTAGTPFQGTCSYFEFTVGGLNGGNALIDLMLIPQGFQFLRTNTLVSGVSSQVSDQNSNVYIYYSTSVDATSGKIDLTNLAYLTFVPSGNVGSSDAAYEPYKVNYSTSNSHMMCLPLTNSGKFIAQGGIISIEDLHFGGSFSSGNPDCNADYDFNDVILAVIPSTGNNILNSTSTLSPVPITQLEYNTVSNNLFASSVGLPDGTYGDLVTVSGDGTINSPTNINSIMNSILALSMYGVLSTGTSTGIVTNNGLPMLGVSVDSFGVKRAIISASGFSSSSGSTCYILKNAPMFLRINADKSSSITPLTLTSGPYTFDGSGNCSAITTLAEAETALYTISTARTLCYGTGFSTYTFGTNVASLSSSTGSTTIETIETYSYIRQNETVITTYTGVNVTGTYTVTVSGSNNNTFQTSITFHATNGSVSSMSVSFTLDNSSLGQKNAFYIACQVPGVVAYEWYSNIVPSGDNLYHFANSTPATTTGFSGSFYITPIYNF